MDLNIPILQKRIKTKSGYKTIAPVATWTGWYFSEQLINAKKYGYEFEVLWGYMFEKQFILKQYVTDLYEIKKNSESKSANYIISKLLLNSLYGRFGINPDKCNYKIIKGSENIGNFITSNKTILDCV